MNILKASVKVFKYIFILITLLIGVAIIFSWYNLIRGIDDYQVVKFNSLPTDVRNVFIDYSDSLVKSNMFRCVTVNPDCVCNMQSYLRLPFSSAFIEINNCEESFEVDGAVSAYQLFVIKDDYLYFLILSYVGYNDYTKLSHVTDIRLSKYGKLKYR